MPVSGCQTPRSRCGRGTRHTGVRRGSPIGRNRRGGDAIRRGLNRRCGPVPLAGHTRDGVRVLHQLPLRLGDLGAHLLTALSETPALRVAPVLPLRPPASIAVAVCLHLVVGVARVSHRPNHGLKDVLNRNIPVHADHPGEQLPRQGEVLDELGGVEALQQRRQTPGYVPGLAFPGNFAKDRVPPRSLVGADGPASKPARPLTGHAVHAVDTVGPHHPRRGRRVDAVLQVPLGKASGPLLTSHHGRDVHLVVHPKPDRGEAALDELGVHKVHDLTGLDEDTACVTMVGLQRNFDRVRPLDEKGAVEIALHRLGNLSVKILSARMGHDFG